MAQTHWWVSQNKTYKHEVPGGYLWSPVRKSNGARYPFYDYMLQVQPGDLVFSYYKTYVQAVGIATSSAEPSVKPDFGSVGENWSAYGWLVQVEFQLLSTPVKIASHMDVLRPLLPPSHAPIQPSGRGNEIYLTKLPMDFAFTLRALIGEQFTLSADEALKQETPFSVLEEEFEALQGRTDMQDTERRQLVNARVGQGLFKNNVRLNEDRCRVTGVSQLHHLRASHIKPWKASNDEEKLHGCNGLLLAPHVDHLFDRGFISFEGNGELIISETMEPEVLTAWAIDVPRTVGNFNSDQKHFLNYHREHILLPRTG